MVPKSPPKMIIFKDFRHFDLNRALDLDLDLATVTHTVSNAFT